MHKDAVNATQAGWYKYIIEGLTPNSAGRKIGAVIIPNAEYVKVKIVTVYWVDEASTRAGNLLEE